MNAEGTVAEVPAGAARFAVVCGERDEVLALRRRAVKPTRTPLGPRGRRRGTTRARGGRPTGVRALPPSAATVLYTRALLDLDEAVAAAITEVVKGVPLTPERTDAAADGAGPADPKSIRALLARLRKLPGEHRALLRKPLALLNIVAKRTEIHSQEEWRRALKELGVSLDDVITPDLRAIITEWKRRNIALIKALPELAANGVARTIEKHKGARVETLARHIEEATGASESHARLLARDQTLKLYSQVTQERHQAAGVTEYVWRSSRDERVRERHKALDGTRQKYSDPPVVDEATGRRAHPGDDFQCRCTADPVLPGID